MKLIDCVDRDSFDLDKIRSTESSIVLDLLDFSDNTYSCYSVGIGAFLGYKTLRLDFIDEDMPTIRVRDLLNKVIKYTPKYNKCLVSPIGKLVISYPVKNYGIFTINLVGKTWRDLFKLITEAYNYVYSNESKFGVWGHAIGSLMLRRIRIYQPVNDSCCYILLSIDS